MSDGSTLAVLEEPRDVGALDPVLEQLPETELELEHAARIRMPYRARRRGRIHEDPSPATEVREGNRSARQLRLVSSSERDPRRRAAPELGVLPVSANSIDSERAWSEAPVRNLEEEPPMHWVQAKSQCPLSGFDVRFRRARRKAELPSFLQRTRSDTFDHVHHDGAYQSVFTAGAPANSQRTDERVWARYADDLVTYRRSHEFAERAWRAWLETYRDDLAALALPLELYISRHCWEDFLANGTAAIGIGRRRTEFDFNSMSVVEQGQLVAFLERVRAPTEPTSGLLGFLRARAAERWTRGATS